MAPRVVVAGLGPGDPGLLSLNAAAALLLSDLYVTGDGVPRNCDQARLLLDAAARKGVPGAGERIRDLPNLGCE